MTALLDRRSDSFTAVLGARRGSGRADDVVLAPGGPTDAFLADMLDGYLMAAVWTLEESDDSEFDLNAGDLHPDSLQLAQKTMQAFADAHWSRVEDLDPSQVGHDLWLSRNGHGCGFFDRDLGDLGDRLQAAAEALGSSELYVGDDRRLHLDRA